MPVPLRMPCSPRTALVPALLTLALGPAAAGAQVVPRPTPPPARQTASINLLGIPFGVFAGEYERAVGTAGFAVGVGGTASFGDDNFGEIYVDDSYGNDDVRYSSLQGKLKYYPTARGLRGFAVGVTLGAASARGTGQQLAGVDTITVGPNTFLQPRYTPYRSTTTRPTVGTVLDYNFLFGQQQRFLVGLGVGARRTLGGENDQDRAFPTGPYPVVERYRPALDRTLFDGRLQIGVGF